MVQRIGVGIERVLFVSTFNVLNIIPGSLRKGRIPESSIDSANKMPLIMTALIFEFGQQCFKGLIISTSTLKGQDVEFKATRHKRTRSECMCFSG